MSAFQELVGKTVKEIWLGNDDVLRFVTNEGDLFYHACADCCSVSWFEGFVIMIGWMPFTIKGVVEIPRYDAPGSRQSDDKIHPIVLQGHPAGRTNYGNDNSVITLVLRNSSNGYYDGTVDFVGDKEPAYLVKAKIAYTKLA